MLKSTLYTSNKFDNIECNGYLLENAIKLKLRLTNFY